MQIARHKRQPQIQRRRSDDPVGHFGDDGARDMPQSLGNRQIKWDDDEPAAGAREFADQPLKDDLRQSPLLD